MQPERFEEMIQKSLEFLEQNDLDSAIITLTVIKLLLQPQNVKPS